MPVHEKSPSVVRPLPGGAAAADWADTPIAARLRSTARLRMDAPLLLGSRQTLSDRVPSVKRVFDREDGACSLWKCRFGRTGDRIPHSAIARSDRTSLGRVETWHCGGLR